MQHALGMHHNTKFYIAIAVSVIDCMCGYIFCIRNRWIDQGIPCIWLVQFSGMFFFPTVPTPLYGRVIREKEQIWRYVYRLWSSMQQQWDVLPWLHQPWKHYYSGKNNPCQFQASWYTFLRYNCSLSSTVTLIQIPFSRAEDWTVLLLKNTG